MTAILGLSAFYHDSAAALVVDGSIVAAAQEERFTRKKQDSDFPQNAVDYCLREGRISASDLDYVGFYDKPLLKFDRLIETYLAYAPLGFSSFTKALPLWLNSKLHLPREMRRALGGAYKKRFVFAEHHESHAASAFFPSPFEEAAILTLDGVGEWATATFGVGRGNKIEQTHEQHFPHSLGLLYSSFTYYCGFKVNGGEYKLMGLAPYGDPKYVDLILDNLLDLKKDGSFRLDLAYFDFCHGLTMTSSKFHDLFGGPPRKMDTEIPQKMMDIAASIQKVTEEVMLRCARHVHARTGMKNLCLAGGVALNCVGNGRILREGPFENIWIQPAADDAGGALGVALLIWHQLLGKPRTVQPSDAQRGSLLGPKFAEDEVRKFVDASGAAYEYFPDDASLCDHVAEAIADGKVIGWFQDRMEFGPRALGSRSIIGDPRSPKMQATMNVKVKFREGFRPFAPAVLEERMKDYFDISASDSPYMLLVAPVGSAKRRDLNEQELELKGIDKLKQFRSEIPAVTHVDYSARIQSVNAERNGIYYQLIKSFYDKTGCPVIVNTSFNLGWDPIVCAPKEAYETFMASDIDVLCLGRYVLHKAKQHASVGASSNGHGDVMMAELLASPSTGGALELREQSATCAESGHLFHREDGVWNLNWPEGAKPPFADAPFPSYDGVESVRALVESSRKDAYARALDRSIPYNTTVLVTGAGTGHLVNYLGVSCRRVVGADGSADALKLGERFRREQGLDRVRFVQMNPERPCFRKSVFDVVVDVGTLQHAADPRASLEQLLGLVKPQGHLVVGLFAGSGARTSRAAATFGGRFGADVGVERSLRSIDDVLALFDAADVDFIRGMPSTTPRPESLAKVELFEAAPRGTSVDHFVVGLERAPVVLLVCQKRGEAELASVSESPAKATTEEGARMSA